MCQFLTRSLEKISRCGWLSFKCRHKLVHGPDFKPVSCMADLIAKSLQCVAGAEGILITNLSCMSEDMTFAFIPLYLKRLDVFGFLSLGCCLCCLCMR